MPTSIVKLMKPKDPEKPPLVHYMYMRIIILESQTLGGPMCNQEIARQLVDYAHFLEMRGDNLFRVRAYRRAAETVLGLSKEIGDLYCEQGVKGIRELPGIGSHLSYTIESLILSGRFETVEGVDEAFGMSRCLGCG